MKFSIGDKIILKQTGEEGHVVAYINAEMIEVEVGGTSFPVYMDDVDHPYLTWFTDKTKKPKPKAPPEQLPVEKEKARPPRLAKGAYLSFLPVFKANEIEDIVDHLKVYLINELPQALYFHYDVRVVNNTTFKHEGKLQAFGNLFLHTIPFEDMNDQPRFHWQLSSAENAQLEQADGILRIKPPKLFEHINQLLQKNEPGFSYLLIDDFLPQKKVPVEKEIPVAPTPLPVKPTVNYEIPKYEVDLHIEQLVPTTKGLTNADMLQIQLQNLQYYLDLAIKHNMERMMVIHGMGKGVLRDEVHKLLKQTPWVSYFTSEWQGKYGFGATEVFFKY